MRTSLKAATVTAGVVLSLGLAGPAFASAGDYGSQPGFAVSNSHTPCAGHGAFGVFGPGESMAGGANGAATGANNSGLCGNPQR
jgi:hypothetical protein